MKRWNEGYEYEIEYASDAMEQEEALDRLALNDALRTEESHLNNTDEIKGSDEDNEPSPD